MKHIDITIQIKRAARLVLFAGVFTLAAAAFMGTVPSGKSWPLAYSRALPSSAEKSGKNTGLKTALIWLELAETSQETWNLILGPAGSPLGREIRRDIINVNRVDFMFMIGYSILNAFIFMFVYLLNRVRSRAWFGSARFVNLGFLLAGLMLIGDLMENLQMSSLLTAGSPEEMQSSVFSALYIFTRLKWGAIFTAALLLGPAYASYFGFTPGILSGILYGAAGILGFMSLFIVEARFMIEITPYVALGPAWLFSIIHAGFVLFRYKGRIA